MGHEIVTVRVGAAKQPFSIHKNLVSISAAGRLFHKYVNYEIDKGQFRAIPEANPVAFKLFVEYLYTKTIPGVNPKAEREAKEAHVQKLCKLYIFGERFKLPNEFCNKVMDAIQAGLVLSGRTAEPGLIREIYSHSTVPCSTLRKFCAANLVFWRRSPKFIDPENTLPTLIKESDWIFNDFLEAVREFGGELRDPRVREGIYTLLPNKTGLSAPVPDCLFHVHGEGEVCHLLKD